jgi:hypothetical protein
MTPTMKAKPGRKRMPPEDKKTTVIFYVPVKYTKEFKEKCLGILNSLVSC